LLDSFDLSPDLEWILQSSQADIALVIEVLLTTYYAPIWQIAQALEPSTQRDVPFVRQAFIHAANNRYRFRNGMDTAQWFYTAALESLPASVRRNAWPPIAVVLYAFTDLQTTQIARVLKISHPKLKKQLDALERNPAAALQRLGWEVDHAFAAQLKTSWRSAFQQRFPAPDTGEMQIEALAGELAQQAERRRRFQSWRLAAGELLLIGLAILLVAALILAGNRLIPSSDPTLTPVSTQIIITHLVTRMVTPGGP
jgi:hypothetical protein